MAYSDNFDAALASLGAFLPDDDHTLEIGNTAPYARELHDRQGVSVLGPTAGLARRVAVHMVGASAVGGITDGDIQDALKSAAAGEVERLQGFTGAMRPGVEWDPRGTVIDSSPRPEHPRGYADRTTELASSFYSRIDGAGVRFYDYGGKRYVIPYGDSQGDE